jgi:hypothetical protein
MLVWLRARTYGFKELVIATVLESIGDCVGSGRTDSKALGDAIARMSIAEHNDCPKTLHEHNSLLMPQELAKENTRLFFVETANQSVELSLQ